MSDLEPKIEPTAKKQPRGFQPGVSGNPNGRPAGSRNKALAALDAIGTERASEVIQKAIEMALAGDVQAIRIVADRVWPARKGQRLAFELPPLTGPHGLSEAIGAVVQQVANGDLSTDEGAAVVGLIEAKRKALETEELTARLEALERRMSR